MINEEVRRRKRHALATGAIALTLVLAARVGGAGPPAEGVGLAYIGPGAGLSAIGAFLALVVAVVVAVFGFVWYPVKRLLRALGRDKSEPEEEEA